MSNSAWNQHSEAGNYTKEYCRILLGIALMGSFITAVWNMGGFSENQQTALLLKSKGFDYRFYGAIELLLHEKMIGILVMVFGAGLVFYFTNSGNADNSLKADLFIRRQIWLIILGVVNGLIFLFSGDILFHLGIMGILLFPFTRLSVKGLLLATLITALIFTAKIYWDYADHKSAYNKYKTVLAIESRIKKDPTNAKTASLNKHPADSVKAKKDTLTKLQQEEKTAWEGIVKGRQYDSTRDAGEKKQLQSVSYNAIWKHLLQRVQGRQASWTYTKGIWDFGSLILLGMLLFKSGFLTGNLNNKKYLFYALVLICAGLLLGWWRLHQQQISLINYERFINSNWVPPAMFQPFEKLFMVTGYASLVIYLSQLKYSNAFWQAWSAVGRLVLTNYLILSIVSSLFFYGYGLGYFGRLTQVQLYLFAAEVILVQVILSVLWIRFYKQGPAEWLLNSLVNGTWESLPKQEPKVSAYPSSITSN
ncbi:DUF418 domain-containing protein [Flavihumibacter sediminis]|nr:DUF418 domain-containing protein [Flavihumibacter sediminis]